MFLAFVVPTTLYPIGCGSSISQLGRLMLLKRSFGITCSWARAFAVVSSSHRDSWRGTGVRPFEEVVGIRLRRLAKKWWRVVEPHRPSLRVVGVLEEVLFAVAVAVAVYISTVVEESVLRVLLLITVRAPC